MVTVVDDEIFEGRRLCSYSGGVCCDTRCSCEAELTEKERDPSIETMLNRAYLMECLNAIVHESVIIRVNYC